MFKFVVFGCLVTVVWGFGGFVMGLWRCAYLLNICFVRLLMEACVLKLLVGVVQV